MGNVQNIGFTWIFPSMWFRENYNQPPPKIIMEYNNDIRTKRWMEVHNIKTAKNIMEDNENENEAYKIRTFRRRKGSTNKRRDHRVLLLGVRDYWGRECICWYWQVGTETNKTRQLQNYIMFQWCFTCMGFLFSNLWAILYAKRCIW